MTNELVQQLPTLLGVGVGALATYATTSLGDRARWQRERASRWDAARMQAYTAYGDTVKRVFNLAIRMAAARGLPHTIEPLNPDAEAMEALNEAEDKRTSAWEAILLLGDPGLQAGDRGCDLAGPGPAPSPASVSASSAGWFAVRIGSDRGAASFRQTGLGLPGAEAAGRLRAGGRPQADPPVIAWSCRPRPAVSDEAASGDERAVSPRWHVQADGAHRRGVVDKPAICDVEVRLERFRPSGCIVGRRPVPDLGSQRHLEIVLVRGQHDERAMGLRDTVSFDRLVDQLADIGELVIGIGVRVGASAEVELPVVKRNDEILGTDQAGASHQHIMPSGEPITAHNMAICPARVDELTRSPPAPIRQGALAAHNNAVGLIATMAA